jgi:4-hydroxythreonine-4-phosphate dehydrogenase
LSYSGTLSEITVCDDLWTSRVTSHVRVSAVASLTTLDKICAAADLLHGALIACSIHAPRLAVAGTQSACGSGGLIGNEEITTIARAVERLRTGRAEVAGPLSAETLFIAARRGDYDGVVTMYHHQGQIALKLLGFDRGVTVSGALPVPIATPAHETAFDIAGKGVAAAGVMRQAFTIPCRMAATSAATLNPPLQLMQIGYKPTIARACVRIG